MPDRFDKPEKSGCLIGSANRELVHVLMITFFEIAECDHKSVITKKIILKSAHRKGLQPHASPENMSTFSN